MKKGIGLIIAVLVMVGIISLVTVLLLTTVSESNLSKRHAKSVQAFWLAEAGVDAAKAQLIDDWYNRASGTNNLASGKYSFTISDTDISGNPLAINQLRVVAVGDDNNGITKALDVLLQDYPVDTFQYAVLGVDLVELKTGITVHCDIYVDGDVEVLAGASILKVDDSVMPIDPNAYSANVSYTGVNKGITGTVEGAVAHTTDIVTPPTFDFNQLKLNADFIVAGGTKLSGHLIDGVYYVTGDVELNNVTLDRGAIITDGMIEVYGGFDLKEPEAGFPALANQSGTIEIDDTADIKGLVYTADAGIELKTGATMKVYGSVIAADSNVEIKTTLGSLDIYHKDEYLLRLPESTLETVDWKEQNRPYRLIP